MKVQGAEGCHLGLEGCKGILLITAVVRYAMSIYIFTARLPFPLPERPLNVLDSVVD